ncbi:hypothetical protein LWC34_50135 [Kibdelosporangium philippinense]|uniref:Secreted protein n=1 Tax=Kibdelosporangium philippinense TaxID=211113 RepID=A0ABS8ZTI1_9PSEU|nr:hypothetical protein [Kibdelosporangium philippinense]MCE7010912.1 hypothetical protein [Kibdelosporangium philippinense]
MAKAGRVIGGLVGAAGLIAIGVVGTASASADTSGSTQDVSKGHHQPPKGARATVRVSPNPTTERGQEVTITGDCGGGPGLKAVIGGFPDKPALVNIRILKDDPKAFLAKANLAPHIGNGVGPVFVDCGGEVGVTLLVTHV